MFVIISSSFEHILNSVSQEDLNDLTSRFLRVPSHWELPQKEVDMVNEVASFLESENISFELQKVEGERSNIIAHLKGNGSGRSLALVGHLDTVPPYNMKDPFSGAKKGDRIYGRGAVDMKGPDAVMLLAIAAFKRAGIELKGDLYFAGVLAEETNSDGAEALIESGFRTDGVIVGEPSSIEYSIGHRGLEWIEVEFTGKIAHGGYPEKGINAILQASRFIDRVQEKIVPMLKSRHHPHMGSAVMNFGRIEGGMQPSTVAGSCTIQLDRRYIPGESVESLMKEYQGVIDELSREDPTFRADLRLMDIGIMNRYQHVPLETSPDDPIVDAIIYGLEEVHGKTAVMSTKHGWTDAALFSHYGKMPTIVYGPGSVVRAHGPEEYITEKELMDGLKTYILTAMKYCGI
ncbi:MAG: M20 family metallopeptidase [Synergistales bacterium]|nr:M20 family metallopeptidase [Synergistales bacterium]